MPSARGGGQSKGHGGRWWAPLLVGLVLWIVPAVAAQTPESGTGISVAGLLIDYGDGRRSYAVVPFEESSVSGIDMLERSGLTLVTIPFGGLGEGVCSIEATGCDVGDCRTRLCQSADRESPFWQYLRQKDDGAWAPAAAGATQARVEDGDVDAWVWSGELPDLPPLTVGSLRDRLRVSDEWASSGGGLPEPIVLTEGGAAAETQDATWRQVASGLVVIAGVGGVGWVIVRRTRRPGPVER